jgi:mRNA interferase MazF
VTLSPDHEPAAAADPVRADLQSPVAHSRAIARGDIFWIDADDSRGSIPGRPHPHVVVQDDVFNQSRLTSVIVCALSTNAKLFNEPGNVLLDPLEGNLEKQSVVVVSRISSVEKSQLGPRIGALANSRVDEILAGLRLQQHSFFHRDTPGDV